MTRYFFLICLDTNKLTVVTLWGAGKKRVGGPEFLPANDR